MLQRILLLTLCLGWLVLAVSAPAEAAEVQRAGDPPPVLSGTDLVKLAASAALAVVGLGLVVWSLRPRRQSSRTRPRSALVSPR